MSPSYLQARLIMAPRHLPDHLVRGAGLLRFIAKRLALSVGVLFGVTVITFVVSRVIVPNPVRAWAGTKAGATMTARPTQAIDTDDLFGHNRRLCRIYR